jgi:hypothetical protein
MTTEDEKLIGKLEAALGQSLSGTPRTVSREELLSFLINQWKHGKCTVMDITRAKMDLDVADAQIRSAEAGERNAKYMLASVVAAAISAIASLMSALTLFGHGH